VSAVRESALHHRRIAIVVDHPLRDLAGLVLVAVELCQRGAVCHLVPLNIEEAEIWALRPDFVLLNYLRRGANEDFARNLVHAGIRFGLHDTEGGVWPSEADYAETLWADRELLHATRCACIWGPRLARHLVETGLLEARQVRVTGCARFDTYHSRWRGILASEGNQDAHPRILINTNYYTVNSRFVTADGNRAQLEAMGWTAVRARRAVEIEAVALEAMIELAGGLARRFPEATIVLRPHPFESPERYRDSLQAFGNIEINATGPVQPELFRANAVIQRSCTTAIEATLASVPALSPRWISTVSENPMAEELSIPCESPKALLDTVGQILEGRYVACSDLLNRRRKVIYDWFFQMDGMAHHRVVEAIGESLNEARGVDVELCRRLLYGVKHGRAQQRIPIGSRVRHALRLSPHWSFRRMRTVVPGLRPEKAFAAAEVDALVGRVAELRARAGMETRPVSVSRARETCDYNDLYQGHAVTLRADG
jgi:surface carbohydrate biosynthesis protein